MEDNCIFSYVMCSVRAFKLRRKCTMAKFDCRCEELQPYQYPLKGKSATPLFVGSRYITLCTTAKAGSSFWKTFLKKQKALEIDRKPSGNEKKVVSTLLTATLHDVPLVVKVFESSLQTSSNRINMNRLTTVRKGSIFSLRCM